MKPLFRPRVLDASAVVDLLSGNPTMLSLLDGAWTASLDDTSDNRFVLLPVLAIAEAQAVLEMASSLWEHVLRMPGVDALPLTEYGALAVGKIAGPRIRHHPVHTALIGPLMAAQVLHEAKEMNAVIMTRVPEAYGAHEVTIHTI